MVKKMLSALWADPTIAAYRLQLLQNNVLLISG